MKFLIWQLCTLVFIVPGFGKDYMGAELFSNNKVKYGRFEIRMMAAYGSGTLSTFFTYYDDSYMGLPEPWREIDIEVLGKDKHAFQSNIITGDAANRVTSEEIHEFNTDLTSRFHTYTVEWTPDYIAYFFNGKEVRRTTGQQVIDCRDKEQSYRFNTWISDVPEWVGTFDPSILPIYQYINWIKFYDYTPGSGENGSDFSFSWEDNFDTFDSNRWSKADWTFDGNLVDFSPNNIVVQGGVMVLCLTSASSPGFSGQIPNDDGTTSLENKKNGANIHQKKSLSLGISELEKWQGNVYSVDGRNLLKVNPHFNQNQHSFVPVIQK